MKTKLTLIFLITTFYAHAQMQFVSPKPGATMQNPDRNIVIRPGNLLDASSLSHSLFTITGSISGRHDFKVKLARDGKTINLNPDQTFAFGERVAVEVKEGILQTNGEQCKAYSFSFSIHRKYTPEEEQQISEARVKTMEIDRGPSAVIESENKMEEPSTSDYTILVNTNATPGQTYLSNNRSHVNEKMWIIQNNGDSVFSTQIDHIGSGWTLNHNGYMTAFNDSGKGSFSMYDSNYVENAVLRASNGYPTDLHELQIFPDGHYFIIGLDIRVVDMTVYNSSYQTNALVTGNVIQEFDADTNLLFEWNTFDYIAIPEALHENLANGQIDAVHMNAIEVDTDGNILVSCRHLDQVDKIDLSNGNFIWRLGGDSNQFVFTNDPAQFDYQHDVRRLKNGDITIFDNNHWGVPNTAYAKEYQLDEKNKKAKLVWSYTHPPINGNPMTSIATGSVQRFDNGNTLIDWGFVPTAGGFPNLTEVDTNYNIVWELRYSGSDGIYRTHRTDWNPCARPSASALKTGKITSTTATLKWNAATGAVKYYIQYRKKGDTIWNTKKIASPSLAVKIKNLLPAQKYEWDMQTWCNKKGTIHSGFTAIETFTTDPAKEENLTVDGIHSLEIYPNPATVSVVLHWIEENTTQQSADIQVVNLMGQIVMEKKLSSSTGANEATLDIQSLSKGFYMIRLLSDNQHFEAKWMKE